MSADSLETTRDRILEAAGKIFADRGFQDTTIRDICQAAGVNVAAVNYHFGDKRRLYVEAVVRAHRWRLDRAKLPDWPANTPPRQRLGDFIETFLRRVLDGPDNTWHTRLVMREIVQPSDACAEIVHANIHPQFNILQEILRDLLPADTPDDALHLAAFSIVGQCLFYHIGRAVVRNLIDDAELERYDLATLADHVTQFSLAAIDSRSKPPQAEA